MFLYIEPLNKILNTDHIVSIHKYNCNTCPKIHINLIDGNTCSLNFDGFDGVESREKYLTMLTITLGVKDVD